MTDLPKSSSSGLYYRLTAEEWNDAWEELKPTEIRILYHLRLLDPFGDRNIDIGVRELGRTLDVDHSTVSRALKVLDEKGYIDLELLKVKVRVHSKVVADNTTGDSTHHDRSSNTNDDRYAPLTSAPAISETEASEASPAFSTETPFVPEQTFKNLVNNKSGATPTPAPTPLNGKGYCEIRDLIPERAGVPVNAALASVIEEVHLRYPEEAYGRVCNAISAYLEQKAIVRNPQGFISAALRRGFTSNQAKKQKRIPTETEKSVKTTVPRVLDLSGLVAEIQIHCQRLGITVKQAIERFGRAGRSLNDLTDLDLATLRFEMAGWSV